MTSEQAEQLLDRVKDFALCSDLRMYAWARRRELQDTKASSKAIQYARDVEESKTQFAEEAYKGLHEFAMGIVNGKGSEIEVEADKEISELAIKHNQQADKALRIILANNIVSNEELTSRAAAGFVVSNWRDIVEPWHYLFTNAQMSWMSMVATRDVMPFFDIHKNRVDPRIEALITDPNREALPGIVAKDAFGPAWDAIAERMLERIKSDRKYRMHPASYIDHAEWVCPRWWGCSGWPEVAEDVASQLKLSSRQATLLARMPYKLSFSTWESVIGAIRE